MKDGATRGRAAPAASALRELTRAFERSPSAVALVAGAEHTLLYANAALRGLITTGSADAAVGQPLEAAFGHATGTALTAALDTVRTGGRSWRGLVPTDGSTGDPSDRWPCAAWALDETVPGEDSTIVVELDASAVSAQARLRFRDVTERVLLCAFREEDRADAAERVNGARRQVIAAMSHDLRTPLQAIGGYARLFEMGLLGPVTPKQQHALVRIEHAMQHVLSLATGLLAHDSIEAGTVHFALKDVPAAATVHEAVSLLQTQADAKGIQLRVGTCDRSVVARVDADKLRQILVNLLNNAVKFTPPGGEVAATCESKDVGGATCVAICISDTGRGISAEDLPRVFEPYVQVGRAVATGEAGVGLGLAISRALAAGMGGTLTVESTVGDGSTFTLTLPQVASPA